MWGLIVLVRYGLCGQFYRGVLRVLSFFVGDKEMKRSSIWHLAILALAATALLAGDVMAQGQEGGRRGRGGRGGFGRMMMNAATLIGIEQVQKELELADEQKAEIKKLTDEMQERTRAAFAGVRDLSEEERRAKFEEMAKEGEARLAEAKKKIDEVLLPEQRERLDQIVLQVQGTQALATEAVAAKLSLSDEQKKKIEEVQEAQGEKMRELREAGRDGGGREAFDKLRTETQEKVNAILTAEQKEKLAQLKGKAFELDRSQFRGPGGGGRGNRNRGEGRQRPANDA
jgi:Spy/CpxP family protein refolding chaperone